MKKEHAYPLFSDEYFMNEALEEARKAMQKDEVPVGAVIVIENRIIARAHNLTETLNDVTAHAEMQAFTSASDHLGGKYLNECVLYVTLEPCVMCAGGAFWAQLGKLVYGAEDNKRGFCLIQERLLHPKTEVIGGILSQHSRLLLQEYFKMKR